jgi:pimeloyl-ACP methyl ester carboxylesterase
MMIGQPDNTVLYKSSEGYQEVMDHYQTALQGLMVPYETRYVDSSYGPTHVVICGREDGYPIVLWHGQNANVTSWFHWLPALSTTYHVYMIDVIGGMGRSAPCRPSKKGLAYGQWAAEVLDQLELAKANMIGASQGTWLITKLANVAPEMIRSAVLLSAAGIMPLDLMMVFQVLPRVLFKSPEVASKAMVDVVTPPDVTLDPYFQELLELMLRHFRSESAAPVMPDEEIKKLTAPSYLLMGQYETAVKPYKVLERGVSLLPNLIRAEIVPGVGHSMIHRKPDWVPSRVINFIEQYGS